MKGQFGVFAGVVLLAEFDDHEEACGYRSDLLEEHIPESCRMPSYDPKDLEVHELPQESEEFAGLIRVWYELKASRRRDREALRDDA